MGRTVAHFDLDLVKYAVSGAGEKRSVIVTHKVSGKSFEVDNKTQWYGHWKKKEGGILAEINKSRTSPFLWDEFDYEDVQTPEPLANVLHSAKLMTERAVIESGADDVVFYIGRGDSFRVERSTLLKYKDNRSGQLKPLLLEDVVEYLTKKFKPNVITGVEVDDAVTIASWGKDNHFILGVDKDYYGTECKYFNLNKPEEGVVETKGFGELWLDDKGKVRGIGRQFKYFQIISQDTTDNYKANCFSDVKWGDKSAFDALKDSKNDKESWAIMRDVFKHLYPEEKEVVGWRGDKIVIDDLYVFDEMFAMVHMWRWDNDIVNVRDVLKKYKLI